MHKRTLGLLLLVMALCSLVAVGCGAGGGALLPKDTGPETIRATPRPGSGFSSPPLPP